MNKTTLEIYFKSDKSSWFKVNEKGIQEWDNFKINEFWDWIRKFKMEVADLNFENYRFPKFNGLTFWREEEDREFNQNVNFRYAIFQGYTEFQGVKFNSYVDFIEANFIELTSFNVTSFLLQVNFNNARFYNDVNFIVANFEKGVFSNTSFIKKAEFNNSYLKNTTFEGCNFSGMLNFTDAEFIENTLFYETHRKECEILLSE
ncbi:MAG: pentapeptide repeat-containing protein [Lutibacter sp.]